MGELAQKVAAKQRLAMQQGLGQLGHSDELVGKK
jgi:hypothetical protein